jgi:hypothetical protein
VTYFLVKSSAYRPTGSNFCRRLQSWSKWEVIDERCKVQKLSFQLFCSRRNGHWQLAVTCMDQRLSWGTDSDLAVQRASSFVMELSDSILFPEDPATL